MSCVRPSMRRDGPEVYLWVTQSQAVLHFAPDGWDDPEMSIRRRVFEDQNYVHFVTFSCYRRRRLLSHDGLCRIVLGNLDITTHVIQGSLPWVCHHAKSRSRSASVCASRSTLLFPATVETTVFVLCEPSDQGVSAQPQPVDSSKRSVLATSV